MQVLAAYCSEYDCVHDMRNLRAAQARMNITCASQPTQVLSLLAKPFCLQFCWSCAEGQATLHAAQQSRSSLVPARRSSLQEW